MPSPIVDYERRHRDEWRVLLRIARLAKKGVKRRSMTACLKEQKDRLPMQNEQAIRWLAHYYFDVRLAKRIARWKLEQRS